MVVSSKISSQLPHSAWGNGLARRPLQVLYPGIIYKLADGRTFPVPLKVEAGLSASKQYPFPPQFQADYQRQHEQDERFAYRCPAEKKNIEVNGSLAKVVSFAGFSQAATRLYFEDMDENAELVELIKREMGIELPQLSEEEASVDSVCGALDGSYQVLAELGLEDTHGLAYLIPKQYPYYFSFGLTIQSAWNLFRMALNCFRMKQLVALREEACRDDSRQNKQRIDNMIGSNMEARSNYCFWDTGKGIKEIDKLDLELRLALLRQTARRRMQGFECAPPGGWQSLALFTWGEAYRTTVDFFLGLEKKRGLRGADRIFKKLLSEHSFLMERSMIFFVADQEGLWINSDPLVDTLTKDHYLLPYQGAQILSAYERIFGQRAGLRFLLDIPTPFDLYQMIELQYAPKA